MAQLLGTLNLQARDSSDLFFEHQLLDVAYSDTVEKALLEDAEHINSFLSDANETDLQQEVQDLALLPLSLETGNQQVRIVYRDSEQSVCQYEVMVYLLIEEE
jgi:hypothetical protein